MVWGMQVFARWERSGESCPGLSYDAFREAVRENERLLAGLGALQVRLDSVATSSLLVCPILQIELDVESFSSPSHI